nr:MAG TPA: hypothetical protein [Caudoviricetes sp.]
MQSELSDSDYKIIKCYEASLCSEQAPYDVVELHKERQNIRDKIAALEKIR